MSQVTKIALIFYLFLLVLVWMAPLSFTACAKDSFWCSTSFWLTQSAGKYGTLGIILITSVFYTFRLSSKKQKMFAFARSLVALLLVLSVFAYTNEHATKKILKEHRPSHTYIVSEAGKTVNLDSMYELEKEQRQLFLVDLIDSSPTLKTNVDKRVLEHWVEEAGYSFPSGHSFNAFLLASILAYSLYHSRYKKMFFLPFAWAVMIAVSRVAIGAHTALDVSCGAAMGIVLALLLLYFDTTRNLVTAKKRD